MATQRSTTTKAFGKSKSRKAASTPGATGDFPPPSASLIRELRRRVKDIKDRERYLLVSVMSPAFLLYYTVSDDTFAMNEPNSATLFKRRTSARAIQKLLGHGIQLVQCRVDRKGVLVKNSLPRKFQVRRRRTNFSGRKTG